jgi:hypothetical protein
MLQYNIMIQSVLEGRGRNKKQMATTRRRRNKNVMRDRRDPAISQKHWT